MRLPPLILAVVLGVGLIHSHARALATSWVVSIEGDLVTVQLDGAPLRWLLSELARQGGFRLHLSKRLGAPLISAQFTRLPVEHALERLLAGWPYAIFYAARDRDHSVGTRITAVAVLAPAEAVPELSGDHAVFNPALRGSEPEVELRLQALE
jgi:hypothetical protein